ncbi:hypothetical protein [Novosphingobium huizhouense]|nr:hypothetical protein [Novosphingobium huizhouense]
MRRPSRPADKSGFAAVLGTGLGFVLMIGAAAIAAMTVMTMMMTGG